VRFDIKLLTDFMKLNAFITNGEIRLTKFVFHYLKISSTPSRYLK